MRRLSLRFAVALTTCFIGVSLSGVWKAATPPNAPPRVAATTPYYPPPVPTLRARDEEEIREIIRQYDLAQTRHDESFFKSIEADSFVLMLRDGRTRTRSQAIADMLTWPKDNRYTSDVSSIEFHGNVAVVTGSMTVTSPGDESGYSWRWVDLFVKRDGRWQILSTVQID